MIHQSKFRSGKAKEWKMNRGLSDKIRIMAKTKYVIPAIDAGKGQFSIRVRDLLEDLKPEGFPSGHTPQICSALQTSKFLQENRLEITGIDGPPSKVSPTVVVHYRVTDCLEKPGTEKNPVEEITVDPSREDPDAWAFRLTEKLRGLLKDELAEYGGGEAFLRWIRSEDEDAA